MKDPCEFHKIDYLRVALQVRGAKPLEIEEILAGMRKLASSEEAFDRWNEKLDLKGKQVLGMMLTPKGEPLVETVLQKFLGQMAQAFRITPDEIEQLIKSRLSGLN